MKSYIYFPRREITCEMWCKDLTVEVCVKIISIWKERNGHVRENFQGVCKKFQITGMHSQFLWGILLTIGHFDERETNGDWVGMGGGGGGPKEIILGKGMCKKLTLDCFQ